MNSSLITQYITYDPQDIPDKRDIIDSLVLKDGYSADCVVIYANEVVSVINKLKIVMRAILVIIFAMQGCNCIFIRLVCFLACLCMAT